MLLRVINAICSLLLVAQMRRYLLKAEAKGPLSPDRREPSIETESPENGSHGALLPRFNASRIKWRA